MEPTRWAEVPDSAPSASSPVRSDDQEPAEGDAPPNRAPLFTAPAFIVGGILIAAWTAIKVSWYEGEKAELVNQIRSQSPSWAAQERRAISQGITQRAADAGAAERARLLGERYREFIRRATTLDLASREKEISDELRAKWLQEIVDEAEKVEQELRVIGPSAFPNHEVALSLTVKIRKATERKLISLGSAR